MFRSIRISTYRLIAVLLAFALVAGLPAGAEEAASTATPAPNSVVDSAIEDDGVIRVLLRSLGAPEVIDLRMAGEYAVESDAGFRFERGSEVTLFAQDGDVWLRAGGLTIDMGSSVTLTRHAAADGEENGLYIAQSERENLYCGDLSVSVENGALRAVLAIDIEEYLYGVVAYEMSDSFPIEALKAQAVAARTYAMQRKYASGGRDYDVVDTTADQVFYGYDAEYQNVIAAVDGTRGVVGTYNGTFAGCYYTASNGGQIATPNDIWGGDGDYGYIERKDDPYDLENPYSLVNSVTFSADLSDCAALREMLEAALADELDGEWTLNGISAIEPTDPAVEGSRMYRTLQFTLDVSVLTPAPTATPSPSPASSPAPSQSPSAAPTASPASAPTPSATPTATPAPPASATPSPTPSPSPTPEMIWEARTIEIDLSVYDQIKDSLSIGLNSSDYELITVVTGEGSFTLEMRRFGHGVGMSQRGAQWMAAEYGATWQEILGFYYPGMTLERIDWQTPELTALDALPVTAGYARPDPTPTPTPAPLPALEDGETYATVTLEDASSTLNIRESPSTSARILDRFADGREVIVCSEPDDEGWVRIRTAEVEGYVLSTYLTIE